LESPTGLVRITREFRIADRRVESASRARRRLALGAERADRPARAV
jgi:hypothetical protein